MRILLVLLAMLTGLSLPEVVHATSRTEVADSGVAASSAVAPALHEQRCAARGGVVPQMRTTARRTAAWFPAPALIRSCGFELSDRTRE